MLPASAMWRHSGSQSSEFWSDFAHTVSAASLSDAGPHLSELTHPTG